MTSVDQLLAKTLQSRYNPIRLGQERVGKPTYPHNFISPKESTTFHFLFFAICTSLLLPSRSIGQPTLSSIGMSCFPSPTAIAFFRSTPRLSIASTFL